ncbi:MAG TPA: sigma-54 dependent transcriptional regulator [Polyangia bacterium]|jgi:DNA-binding NtrC family response regulator
MKDKARILVVDDEEIVRESLCGWLQEDGYAVETAADGTIAIGKVRAEPWDVLLVDLKMPGVDGLAVLAATRDARPDAAVIIMTAYATVDTAVQAMKMGAYDYLVKPFEPEELSAMVSKLVSERSLSRENQLLKQELQKSFQFRDLVSKNAKMQSIFELCRIAAQSASTILILGESGTGKELLARAIHHESPRAQAPFIPVSCAALTETLLESELFGHEKGAFTGATQRTRGKFEQAVGGSLFLDEIGDISPKLQLDLLRALEDRKFYRIGGSEPVSVDVRVIAATNRDLKRAVEDRSFREDLYYRLNVIVITLPPLRERKEDLPLLVEHFLERLGAELGRPLRGVSSDAMAALMAHDWPGNVRELRNVLERGAVVAKTSLIELADLGLGLPEEEAAATGGDDAADSVPASLKEVERRHVQRVLTDSGWNITRAAQALGIDRVTLYNKIKKYGLKRDEQG